MDRQRHCVALEETPDDPRRAGAEHVHLAPFVGEIDVAGAGVAVDDLDVPAAVLRAVDRHGVRRPVARPRGAHRHGLGAGVLEPRQSALADELHGRSALDGADVLPTQGVVAHRRGLARHRRKAAAAGEHRGGETVRTRLALEVVGRRGLERPVADHDLGLAGQVLVPVARHQPRRGVRTPTRARRHHHHERLAGEVHGLGDRGASNDNGAQQHSCNYRPNRELHENLLNYSRVTVEPVLYRRSRGGVKLRREAGRPY